MHFLSLSFTENNQKHFQTNSAAQVLIHADCHSILTRWRNYLSQLFNVHGDNDVKQTEIHTAEPLVPEPSTFEVDMAIEKLKRYKSPGIDQIPAELFKAGGIKICSEIHKLIISVWNKEELPDQWKLVS
jgi:hypothetical protein